MTEIFISYSRRDKAFVERFLKGLNNNGYSSDDIWVDWEDIPASSDWQKEIRKGIEGSNSIIFILSPEWAKSNECAWELKVATEYNKRLFPIVLQNVDPNKIQPELASLNRIFFRETDNFDEAMRKLIAALHTDLGWVSQHTNLLRRANEWNAKNRDNGYLLRGPELQEAEAWLAQGFGNKIPSPTPLQAEYIVASQQNARRGIVGAIGNAISGGNRQSERIQEERKAREEAEKKIRELDEKLSVREAQERLALEKGESIQQFKTQAEEERKAREEAEKKIKELDEKVSRQEEQERLALEKGEAERRAREEEERLAAQKAEEEQRSKELAELTLEQIAERDAKLRAAIAANILNRNRAQAVLNDRSQGDDQLGIKDEVEALAETLLLRDVEPPVAVGVMGGWGSGKSFVMYLIGKYVEQTRAKAIQKGWPTRENDLDVPPYVGHIYQINFNAWTYAKSNLWASLMDTIFFSLNRQMQVEQLLAHRTCSPEKTENLAEDVRESMLKGGKEFIKIFGDNLRFDQDKDLEEWKENINYWTHHLFKGNLLWSVMRRRQEENLNKLKDTEEQLKQLKSRREQFEKSSSPEKRSIELNASSKQAYLQTIKTVMVAFISDALSDQTKEKLTQYGLTEEDIQKSWKEATGLRGGINAIVAAFRNNRSYWFLTLLFLAVTFALPYLGTKLHFDFLKSWISQAAALFIAAVPVITAVGSWAQKIIGFNEKARTILEDAYKNQQAKQAEEITNSTKTSPSQKIAELQKEVSQGSLAAYDTLINLLEAQAEAERQLIGPSAKYSNLMEFVQSRLDAATYENQLGLMHQVRQDIDELTYSLVDGAREDVFPRGKPRVILYIDDLDRCPPSRVVEILEAVQLLLNTKLFVIILGLDTRYVTRALEKEYKEILQHEGDPSGLDYIEKIIQIPYRVRPIERDSLQKYLAIQMDVEKPPEPVTQVDLQMQDLPMYDIPSVEDAIPVDLQPQAFETDSVLETATSMPVSSQAEAVAQTPDLADMKPLESEPEQGLAPTFQTQTDTQISKPVESKTEEFKLPDVELPPAVIRFKHEDLLDLTACCQQIPLSPRSIKRLVNVFKLMKIFWFRADKEAGLAERDRPRPVKQAAMSLLALSSAYPEVMREAFVHLEGLYRQGLDHSVLFDELNTIKLPPGSAQDLAWQLKKYNSDVAVLKFMAGDGQEKLVQLKLSELKLSTFNIVRSFSFVGDPVYWTDGESTSSQ